ncbi:MAG: alpha-galactosidase [Clostridia bacterium]|nr:alpha-galactosidase [Clostridia bacterium]
MTAPLFRKAHTEFILGGKNVAGDITLPGEGEYYRLVSSPERFSFSLSASEEAVIKSVTAEFDFTFEQDDMLFLNGYQSWTDSTEHPVNGKLRGLGHLPKALVNKYAFTGYGDYGFTQYGRKKGMLHGFSYAYIRRDDTFILLGSLCEESGFTVIRFDTGRNSVVFEKDCKDHCFSGEYAVFDVAVLSGKEDEVFDRYFELLGTPKPRAKRINGYTSWYNRYENITEATVGEDLEGFAHEEKKPDVFQIDDGYESAVGDWLSVDENKFPSGMKYAADKIREKGMIPGLWLAPFAAEKKSKLVKEHPDWLLRGNDGEPAVGGSNWSGFYGLDIYNAEFREYLKNVFVTVINDWGYGLVKLDFLYAACIYPRKDKTRAQVMFEGMRFLRELCGDALIIGCGVPLAPAFGNVDYCRIGCDVSLSWDDVFYMRFMHRERVSTKNSLLNTIFRRQLDGRAFRNDPDVYLLRDDNIQLTVEQKKTLATVNSLFGGVLFTSDNVGGYSQEKEEFHNSMTKLSRSCVTRITNSKKAVTVYYTADGEENTVSVPK